MTEQEPRVGEQQIRTDEREKVMGVFRSECKFHYGNIPYWVKEAFSKTFKGDFSDNNYITKAEGYERARLGLWNYESDHREIVFPEELYAQIKASIFKTTFNIPHKEQEGEKTASLTRILRKSEGKEIK